MDPSISKYIMIIVMINVISMLAYTASSERTAVLAGETDLFQTAFFGDDSVLNSTYNGGLLKSNSSEIILKETNFFGDIVAGVVEYLTPISAFLKSLETLIGTVAVGGYIVGARLIASGNTYITILGIMIMLPITIIGLMILFRIGMGAGRT